MSRAALLLAAMALSACASAPPPKPVGHVATFADVQRDNAEGVADIARREAK